MLPDYNMGILDVIDGIESEHVAAFESRNPKTGTETPGASIYTSTYSGVI